MDEEDGGDEEERVAVRGAGVKQEEGEEDMEERSQTPGSVKILQGIL